MIVESDKNLQIGIVRTMPHFSMDVYADGLITGLKSVYPNWKIVEWQPRDFDRRSRSAKIRLQKSYERFLRFPRSLQKKQVDIYHIIDHSDAHIVRWLKKNNQPVVVTCHDLINYFYPENLQGSVRLPFISDRLWRSAIQSMKYADAIIAVSSTTAEDVIKLLNVAPKRVHVVPNAVDPIFQPAPPERVQAFRQKLNVSSETFCLLNVGSNHPRKNVLTILKVLSDLKKSSISVQLWKINGAFNREQESFIKEHNLTDSICYLDNLDQSALIEAYSSADILIAPSFHEGFGLTLLEAMACGTPVITSNVSAMPEVVGNAGVLVDDPKDSQSIAEIILSLCENPSRYEELKVKGLERSQLFSWEKTAMKIASVYNQLLYDWV